MKLESDKQIFNLYDTNGRRSDILDAYQIYLEILDSQDSAWARWPKSTRQLEFYLSAVSASSGVFKSHSKYPKFLEVLDKQSVKKAFLDLDRAAMEATQDGKWFLKYVDNAAEERARHYTNNLVKIGFADEKRQITPVGRSFMGVQGKLSRDRVEAVLPIDDVNLIVFRQIMKLRVYSSAGQYFFRPGVAALKIVNSLGRVSSKTLLDFIHALDALQPIDLCDENFQNENSLDKHAAGLHLVRMRRIENPFDCVKHRLDSELIQQVFKSRKTSKNADTIVRFYNALWDFRAAPSSAALAKLVACFERRAERNQLNKAFGQKGSVFTRESLVLTVADKFLEANEGNVLLSTPIENLNAVLFEVFTVSKLLDAAKENSDTTRRLLLASGIFTFKNGQTELRFPDLWSEILRMVDDFYVFGRGDSDDFERFEGRNGTFRLEQTLVEIMGLDSEAQDLLLERLSSRYGAGSSTNVKNLLATETRDEFEDFVRTNFPKERVIELLTKIDTRSGIQVGSFDKAFQRDTGISASIPTIYEYLLGLAWYYLADESFDLWASFNLTLNADFLPERFAGAGVGDICIELDNLVILIEATLMNQNAQKRGEWEPVLRHSVNLSAAKAPKPTVTFFVANELDFNTINIWQAVSRVPLEPTERGRGEAGPVLGVTIMPFRTKEIIELLKSGINAETVVARVREHLSPNSDGFDIYWRDKIKGKLLLEVSPETTSSSK